MAAAEKLSRGGVEEAVEEEDPGALKPGAAPFGNFPHYSRFHPPEQRLRLLPPELLRQLFPPEGPERRPILGLDVGCNSGRCVFESVLLGRHRAELLSFTLLPVITHHSDSITLARAAANERLSGSHQDLSVALYKHFLSPHDGEPCSGASRELRLLCCDIDPVLVERAEKDCPFPDALTFITLDIMDRENRKGPLSSFLSQFGRSIFDIVFCMSVTMWIHLNHGDRGLCEFLAHVSSLCSYLLVEPQPWKCYRAAARRLRKLGLHNFDHFRSLAIRGDMASQIVRILTQDHGMELVCCFGNTSWDRSLLLFRAEHTQETQAVPESSTKETRTDLRF